MVQRHDLPLVGVTGAAGVPGTSPRTAAAAVGPGGYDMTKRAADRLPEPSAPAPGEAGDGRDGPAIEAPGTAGEVLSAYLHAQAGDFLRSLRLHAESGADVEEAAEAARLLRRAARRISGALSVYRPITDTAWSDELRAELAWLSGTLALEHAYAGRLARLRDALYRLSGAGGPPDRAPHGDAAPGEPAAGGVDPEAVGASGPTTLAARTARGGVTAGIDGPSPAAPRSSRTTRRSVSLATGTPDPARRGPSPEDPTAAGARTTRSRGEEAPRRPYEGYEERNDDGTPEAPAGPNGTGPGSGAPGWDAAGAAGSADGTDAPGQGGRAAGAGADAAWPVPGAGGDGAGDPGVPGRGPAVEAAGAVSAGGAGAPGSGAAGSAGTGDTDAVGAESAGAAGQASGRGAKGGRAGRTRGAEAARGRGRGGGAPEERTAGHQRAGDAEEARGGALTVGAARAGALLERQLTLARTRAHTAALQALGSSRFHAVADTVALLASEVPLDEATAGRPAEQVLPPLAELANRRLFEAVEALPLGRSGHPYNAEALVHGLAATPAADSPPASDRQDAPWHQVRRLVRMRRYALEVLDLMAAPPALNAQPDAEPSQATRLQAAGQALERHRDAAEAAAAAAAAARTPRIAPATAYALGVLHADQRHEVEAARFAFGRMWRRVVGRTS